MEQRKPISHLTAGLLIASLIVIYAIITQFMGLTNRTGIGIIQYVLIIGGLIFFIMQHGKAHDYRLPFGNLFSYGFKATAVFTIIFVAFLVIFFLLFPELKEQSFEEARKQMEKNPAFSEDQIDQALNFTRRFFWVGVVGGSMFFMILVGAVGSLLGAALTKKRPANPFDQQNA